MKKQILLILFLCVSILNPACAKADSSFLDIKEVTSPGGLKAWLVEDHSVPVITLRFAFKNAGSANDPADKEGLARMVSNTLDEGAGDLDSQSFQKQLQDLSISLSFSAGRDDFAGTLKTLTRNKAEALSLLRKALTEPRFDEEPVQRMRAANQSRIRSSMSDPDWIAARILNDTAYQGHVYAQNSGGTLSSLETITREDLKKFHKDFIGKNNLLISAAGDITQAELSEILDTVFGALPVVTLPAEPTDISVQNQGQTALFKKDIPQTIIEMLQPGIDRNHPDYHTAQIMNFILGSSGFGSRLTKEIREKRGLTYGIYSSFINLDHFDGIGISTSTKNESVPEMLELIKTEWNKIKNEPVSAAELETAQTYLIGALPLSLTSTDDIASMLLSLQLDNLPIDYLDQREKKLRAVTISDIQRVAKDYIDTKKITTVLVGNPENITPDITIETLPHVE